MEAEGLISPQQAEMLRQSVGDAAEFPAHQSRGVMNKTALLVMGGVIVTAVVAFALTVGGGGGEGIQDVAQSLNEPGGYGAMNKSLSTILAVVLLLIVPILIWTWLHNSLVAKEETVFKAWAQTESNLQRRADLVPALVETVSRYLKHESETLESVTATRGEAPARLASAMDQLIQAERDTANRLRRLEGDKLEDEAGMSALFTAQHRVARGITGVMAVVEDYPELKSSDQFLELQAQLEGTENRINVARIRFNESVADYNAATRQLPGVFVASLGGFQRKAYFRSEEEAKNAPELKFD